MHLRQQSSRYCAAVLFLAGVAGGLLFFAVIRSGFKPDFEIWLASALVIALILHARASFALSRAQQELEMVRRQSGRINPERNVSLSLPLNAANEQSNLSADDMQMLTRVKYAVEQDQVDLYLQPIRCLTSGEIEYYEAFSRLRAENGEILRPMDYIGAVERANRIGAIDNMILLRAVQALRALGKTDRDYKVFCNISPATIFDEDFFIRFTDYLDANIDLASRLVFEFTYPAVEIIHDAADEKLQSIAQRGYAFSVDHVRRLDLNWGGLAKRNFKFVKAASGLLLPADQDEFTREARFKEFKARIDDCGIELVAEKIERQVHVSELASYGVQYGIGEHLGAPRPASFYIASTGAAKTHSASKRPA